MKMPSSRLYAILTMLMPYRSAAATSSSPPHSSSIGGFSGQNGELKVLFFHTPHRMFLTTNVMNDCRRFPALIPSAECPYPGYCPEIMQLLARRMGMRRVRPLVIADPDQMCLSNVRVLVQ